jgi:hypothetical protein
MSEHPDRQCDEFLVLITPGHHGSRHSSFSAHIIDLAKEGERDPDKLCEGL